MKRKPGQSIVGLLLAVVILAVIYYVAMKVYFRKPGPTDEQVREELKSSGVNPDNLPGAVKKAQDAADKANALIKKQEEQSRDLEKQ